ncbi:restriction endonuclease subunit S [Enterococcus faecalis]|uniref:restriction endonuclease subunit S n=1 Tax=Enterococcus TaxID=1350 RepID=UPI000667A81E|nr:restriction endonuclease subunit S [Enterococcus faecalis]MDV2519409.1 restriction endonuclease subunit S [Enterococcus faecalis]UKU90780.1 restriction endonuclease subunit S [Enterococcus faecalis]WAL86722.1 restriction endonuclease subunit S [Enterococcus faecalis]WHK64045.1 restriction endonuclease subunit S [Enterococcus faecalis]HCT1806883.1 restriction endonuclease subunit S [Enterococcus faecalis]
MRDEMKKVPRLRFRGFSEEWEQCKLGDLGSVAMNKRIFKEQTSESGDIPFYKIGTFGATADAFISRELFETYKKKYPYPKIGDLLISASGSIGRVVEYKGNDEYFQDSNIVWLKHDDRINNLFLKQFYSIVKWHGLEGSTIKRLYNKNILETTIHLPVFDEQEKIGTLFKQLDDIITLHQRKLEQLKELKKAYLQLTFPKKDETVPRVRFADFEDDWQLCKLGDVVEIFDGTHQTPRYTDSGVKFVSVENIATLETKKYITHEAYEKEYSKKRAKKGDILMTRIGDIGTMKVIETDEPLAYYVTLALLKAKETNPYFLSFIISSPEIQRNIWKRTLHIAFPKKINLGEINQVEMKITIFEEQDKIGDLFTNLDDAIILNQNKLNQLKSLKKSYLQNMFI